MLFLKASERNNSDSFHLVLISGFPDSSGVLCLYIVSTLSKETKASKTTTKAGFCDNLHKKRC